jgi:hypothetical protein
VFPLTFTKEREIPIPAKLVKNLKAWKAKSAKDCSLVFPTAGRRRLSATLALLPGSYPTETDYDATQNLTILAACLMTAAASVSAEAQAISQFCTPKVTANEIVVSPKHMQKSFVPSQARFRSLLMK